MGEKRIGSQTPTRSFVLPYEQSSGNEAIDLYSKTGRTAQPWQELLIYDLLATNDDGLWVHTKYGYSVPRRNGKNEVVAIRELYGLQNGEHILHTAHRTTTTHAAWERLLDLCTKANIEIASSYRAFGKEHIELSNGGKCEFRTRTSKGGLGEGFDLLIIDEAQEYQDDQESALKYVVTDSANPQTLFCGTPPTPVSSGTVFVKFRQATLEGRTRNGGWSEWSVDEMTDPNDEDAWYKTNPSLGTVFTARSVADEIGTDNVDFNIQRLGLWLKYNQHSAISASEWDALKLDKLPQFASPMFVGVKCTSDSVAVSIAIKTKDDKTFVETVDRRESRSGFAWITDFIIKAAPQKVVIDGANGQHAIFDSLKGATVKTAYLPKVADVIAAHAMFEPLIETKKLCHMGQPSLRQAASNCEHRAIGTNGGFGYKSIKNGVDVSILESVVLAAWASEEFKQKQIKQKVNY